MAALELQLPSPLKDLVHQCEVNCVAGCCGLDAFDFDAIHLAPKLDQNGLTYGFLALDQMSDAIELVRTQAGPINSDQNDFNAVWDPEECVEFLLKLRVVILQAVTNLKGQPLFESSWRTDTVLRLAGGISDERAFDRLPILADALQDAGCEDADILAHCRGDGPHVRGCWVVDLVLGKS